MQKIRASNYAGAPADSGEAQAIRGTLDLLVTAYGWAAVQEEMVLLTRRMVLAAAMAGIERNQGCGTQKEKTA